jgi:predicted polyphosphate/ATP-dependent NAD kinase
MRSTPLRIGLVINPYAGLGGELALKGSDSSSLQAAAREGQLPWRAPARLKAALGPLFETSRVLPSGQPAFELLAAPGMLGSDWLQTWGMPHRVLNLRLGTPTTGQDTARAAEALVAQGIDLLVFAGGDGTARDIAEALGQGPLCLGVPAGVKMQSGVYAVTPQAATGVLEALIAGQWLREQLGDVRDLDEEALRSGRVQSRYFGRLRVPAVELVQTIKQGGLITETERLHDWADTLQANLSADTAWIVGPGASLHGLMGTLGLGGSLLGVDFYTPQQGVRLDLTEAQLWDAIHLHKGPCALLLSVIGGQGHIIGRGNQQLSPRILRYLGREALWVLASPDKLQSLQSRPLLIDSGDALLDADWAGLVPVLTGYECRLLYPLSAAQTLNLIPAEEVPA